MMAAKGKSKDQTQKREASKTTSRNSSSCIWAVNGHNYFTRGWLAFEANLQTDDLPPEMLEAVRLTKTGHFLPPERFPKNNVPRSGRAPHLEYVPQIFGSGFTYIRNESADILRQFDLGEGALYPTQLWYPDRVTPVDAEVFYLSLGNWKDAFLLNHSPSSEEWARLGKPSLWGLPPNPKGGELVFSTDALAGPDLWFDKSITTFIFFISDRLARALGEAGLAADWKLIRCPISSE